MANMHRYHQVGQNIRQMLRYRLCIYNFSYLIGLFEMRQIRTVTAHTCKTKKTELATSVVVHVEN